MNASLFTQHVSVLLLTFIPMGTCIAQSAHDDYLKLSVDTHAPSNTLKPLRGVNGVPDMSYASAQQQGHEHRAPNISEAYRQARINLVRAHDAVGAGDIDSAKGILPVLHIPLLGTGGENDDTNVIFPNPSADPNDPHSYNFAATDTMIAGIRGIGSDVIFRIGRGGGTTAEPPRDLEKYGQIIRHVVLHYNRDGLADFRTL